MRNLQYGQLGSAVNTVAGPLPAHPYDLHRLAVMAPFAASVAIDNLAPSLEKLLRKPLNVSPQSDV